MIKSRTSPARTVIINLVLKIAEVSMWRPHCTVCLHPKRLLTTDDVRVLGGVVLGRDVPHLDRPALVCNSQKAPQRSKQ